jgi:hypothetical protein
MTCAFVAAARVAEAPRGKSAANVNEAAARTAKMAVTAQRRLITAGSWIRFVLRWSEI